MKWPFVAGRYPIHWFLRFAAPILQLELSLSKDCHDGVIHYLQGNWGSFLDLTKVTLILKVQAFLKFQLFFKVAKAVCGPESHLELSIKFCGLRAASAGILESLGQLG